MNVCVMCGQENTRDEKMYCKECETKFYPKETFCGECTYWNKYGCVKGHEGCTIDCKDFKRKEN